jgi:hypothetical protein
MTPEILAAARQYIKRGFAVTPIAPGTKRPVRSKWTEERISEAEITACFNSDNGIGVVLGQPSDGLTDVDLDCPEAVRIGERFLPRTEMVHGHPSKPESHFWYRCDPSPAYRRFEDVNGSCILEVRGNGHQTVVPPSLHPSGERLSWDRDGDASPQRASDVERAAESLAAASLLARHWPKGTRNETALALSGALLQGGWDRKDAEEFMRAVTEAADDEEQESRIRTVAATEEKLASGEPTTGMLRLKQLIGEDVVQRAWEWLGSSEECEVVEPVVEQQPWPDPIGYKASYGIVGEIVTKLEPHTEADPAALYLQTLVALGNLIGRNGYIQIEADKHHGNLFCVVVGISSKGRKGTSLGQVRRVLSLVDEGWEKTLPGGLSSGEGLIWAVRDQISRKKPVRIGGKLTYEDVTEDFGVDDKRCLVNEQEFVSVLQMMRREGNILSPLLREAFDRGTLSSMTKNSPARATNAHISIIAHITRDELIQNLDAISMKNGLANRFLWSVVKRSKFLPFGGKALSINFANVIKQLEQVKKFCSQPVAVSWDDPAAEEWEKNYHHLSRERQGAAGEATSRAEAQVARLATLYALLDQSTKIKLAHLDAALEIWRFCEQSANYIFGNSTGNCQGRVFSNTR